MKLGILVVYLVSPDNDWVLSKHLERLARTKAFMDFKVYAAVNRLPNRYRHLLHACHFVDIVALPLTAERESAEHGKYLDMLAAHALADGCDYICTFDVDSWPIRDEWIKVTYDGLVQSGAVGAGILRSENGDTVLPHPSFTFLKANLFQDQDCRYWVNENDSNAEFRRFLSAHGQHADTGAALGYFLESRGLPWVKLRRTNKRDYHYLMAGIYGDVIFHLGASSRKRIVFRNDDAAWVVNMTQPLAMAPMLWRIKPMVLKLLKSTYEPSVHRRNRRAFDAIANRLRSNEEDFYRELRQDSGAGYEA